MNDREIISSRPRGYFVEDVWSPSMPSNGLAADVAREGAVRELDVGLRVVSEAHSGLLAIRSLLYVVRVSGHDLHDVEFLARGLRAATEAISSVQDCLSGRARAVAARDKRFHSWRGSIFK